MDISQILLYNSITLTDTNIYQIGVDCMIITISRQFGSGGRTIAKEVAERLGYQYYDKELIEATVKKSGLCEKFITENEEYATYTNSLLFNLSIAGSVVDGRTMSVYDRLYVAQFNVIKDLAKVGNCVILGRCADYILKDNEDCLNVFIYADMESRAKRVIEHYGESDKSIEKRLKEKDKKRQVYYKNYTGRNWGTMTNYNLCLDSGCIGINHCVDIIVDVVKQHTNKNI